MSRARRRARATTVVGESCGAERRALRPSSRRKAPQFDLHWERGPDERRAPRRALRSGKSSPSPATRRITFEGGLHPAKPKLVQDQEALPEDRAQVKAQVDLGNPKNGCRAIGEHHVAQPKLGIEWPVERADVNLQSLFRFFRPLEHIPQRVLDQGAQAAALKSCRERQERDHRHEAEKQRDMQQQKSRAPGETERVPHQKACPIENHRR